MGNNSTTVRFQETNKVAVSTSKLKLIFDSSYREKLVLANGQTVFLRLIQPNDKQLLLQGLSRMSAHSRYMRFMGVRKNFNEDALRYLCEIDGFDHFAFGASAISPATGEEGVAVARFVRSQNEPGVAEPAIAVIDDYQGLGLGRILLNRLALAARERGIEKFRFDFLAQNRKIWRLLDDFKNNMTILKYSREVTIELDLPQPCFAGESVSETPYKNS